MTRVKSSTLTKCHTVVSNAKVIDWLSPPISLAGLDNAALGATSIHFVSLGLLDCAMFVFSGAAEFLVVHGVAFIEGKLGLCSNLFLLLDGGPGQVIQMNIKVRVLGI